MGAVFPYERSGRVGYDFEDFVKDYTRDMKPKLKHNTWLTKEHILLTKLISYFKDEKMRDIPPKGTIQWQNEQISYRDEKRKALCSDLSKNSAIRIERVV